MTTPRQLPDGLQPYRRTDIFTEETVPKKLLKEHTTKQGAWGLIHVLEGRLLYQISDPRQDKTEQVLAPGEAPGVVEPTILHSVRPIGAVRFYVEFHRKADEEPAA